jgi:hypothetical protein
VINTAKRDKIGFAPADLLYSESLTKSTKKARDVFIGDAQLRASSNCASPKNSS